jgi:nucleoside phosphorylase
MSRPVVLCPLAFELAQVRRAGIDAALVCCGPGGDAVERWAESHTGDVSRVVLVGLAGALGDELRAGEAAVVTEVRDADGACWRPTLGDAGSPRACVVTSTDAVTDDPDDRKALAERRGAQLVDMESVAFARVAEQRGWQWAIVRGVSDDRARRLPPGSAEWVDAHGHARPGAIVSVLLRRPRTVPSLIRLRRDATGAMRAAASHVAALLDA